MFGEPLYATLMTVGAHLSNSIIQFEIVLNSISTELAYSMHSMSMAA